MWHYAHATLGAVLLVTGRAGEGETVYWEDLQNNRENGWSLFGQMQALKAQSKNDHAALVEARFKKAWTGLAVRSDHRWLWTLVKIQCTKCTN